MFFTCGDDTERCSSSDLTRKAAVEVTVDANGSDINMIPDELCDFVIGGGGTLSVSLLIYTSDEAVVVPEVEAYCKVLAVLLLLPLTCVCVVITHGAKLVLESKHGDVSGETVVIGATEIVDNVTVDESG